MTPIEAREIAERIASGETDGFTVKEHDTKIDVLIVTVKAPDVWTHHEMSRMEFIQLTNMIGVIAGLPGHPLDDGPDDADEDDEEESEEEPEQ